MTLDLTQDSQLKQAAESLKPWERNQQWLNGLQDFLSYVETADLQTRKSSQFHQRLWEDNSVSSVGMGTVDISAAIDNPEFREWLAEESLKPLGESAEAIITQLQSLHDEIISRLKEFSARTPHVKIFRVLAALYPNYFTSITNREMALAFHRALFGKRKKPTTVRRQVEIREKLDQVLGPCGNDLHELVERMTIAWYLFTDYVQSSIESEDVEFKGQSGEEVLKPLPAVQRRKGFTSIKGGLGTISNALSFVLNGVTREDLIKT